LRGRGASALGLPAAAAALRPSSKADGGDGITAALLPRVASCRICLEKSDTKEMEQPCACKGTMQYAHKACVQRWLNERPEKGSVQCEVCGKPLKGNWQLWRASDDPLHPHLAAFWHLLLHGSAGADTRGSSEEWAAPGLSSERRRVSGSTAWGLALLLAASGVLFLRQILRVVPSTGERPEHSEVPTRGAGAAIEGMALLLLLSTWFYTQDFSSVQRKLVFTSLFPVTWVWLTTAVLQWRPRAALHLYCACWCLVGYIAAHRFCP
jgi:hypothetical protein